MTGDIPHIDPDKWRPSPPTTIARLQKIIDQLSDRVAAAERDLRNMERENERLRALLAEALSGPLPEPPKG